MFYCMGRKTSRILMGGVLAVCLAAGGITAAAAAAQPQAVQVVSRDNYEWGLSFQEENQPPVPNLSAEELAPYNAHYYAPEAGKRLYLTFDAGYENGNTTAILDALKKHNAPGAFFVVGPYIRDYPDLVKRMVEEGHIVGNHSWHHPNMTQKSQEEFAQELALVEEQFRETVGQEMEKFYRPPGSGVLHRVLESGLCGLEHRKPAHRRAGFLQADSPHPRRSRGAAPFHQFHQRGHSGRIAHPLGGDGLHLRQPAGTGRR